MNKKASRHFLASPAWACLCGCFLAAALVACTRSETASNNAKTVVAAPPTVESSDLLQRAKDRSLRGDTLGAIAAYTELLVTEPQQISALGNRALLNAAIGNNEAALADYTLLLQIDPENYAAIDRRAALCYRMGRYEEALHDLAYIDQHREGDPDLLNRIGEAHLKLGHFGEALVAFDQVNRLQRGSPVAIRNRAATYYAMGDFKRAQADYQLLLDRDPQDSEALNGLGLILQFVDGDLVAAEARYRDAILTNPNNAGAWYNVAFLEAASDRSAKAIQDFGEAIRIDPSYADAYVNRGLLAMRLPDAMAARTDFQVALRLQPTNIHTRMLLGWAKCESGARADGCIDLAEAKSKAEPGAEKLIDTYCK